MADVSPAVFSKLLALFILVPLVELAVFLWLGDRLGLLNTLAVIVITGILGAALTKSQGARALREFRLATAGGRVPHAEIVEGLIILLAGALLLTPGFLTDTVGFLALIPSVRRRVRKKLTTTLASRIKIVTPGQPAAPSERPVEDKVIDV